jgi:acetylornithine deacetylase/succinyl-diaminopimelate desuccinylase-like protein
VVDPRTHELTAAVDAGLDATLGLLTELVAIPSVSSEPARAGDVAASVDRVAELARQAGAADVDVVRADGGAPGLIARWPAPSGAPTVLLYAHADVQPTGDPAAWTSPPFQATPRDGRLYGRGAADDKAGIAAHLAAIAAHGSRPPVGVTLFVEGEEEIGSPTITALLDRHAAELAADVVLIADSSNHRVDVPAFTAMLRGLVDCTVEVRTLASAQHSGVFGGLFPDALTVLCRLLATVHDEDGAVAVAGLVEEGPVPDVEEDEATVRAAAGVLDGVQAIGRGGVAARLASRPAISVLAVDAPRVSEAANVLVPAASALVSLRIPPTQDAEEAMAALRAHLQAHVPWGAHLTVTPRSAGQPIHLPPSGPAADVAVEAFRDAWEGVSPVQIGLGGSIPLVAELAERYPAATVLVVGPGDPASAWHGIDESVDLGVLRRLALAEALLLERLASLTPR